MLGVSKLEVFEGDKVIVAKYWTFVNDCRTFQSSASVTVTRVLILCSAVIDLNLNPFPHNDTF